MFSSNITFNKSNIYFDIFIKEIFGCSSILTRITIQKEVTRLRLKLIDIDETDSNTISLTMCLLGFQSRESKVKHIVHPVVL